MSQVTNNSLTQQVYQIHGGDSLLSQVAKVMCVLMPRSLAVAGFSDRGDLLMLRFSDYRKSLPIWILDFFEHQFINEPLLQAPHKVAAAFVAGGKNMIVPESLYQEKEAEKWMRKIWQIEGGEILTSYYMREDKANYMYTWPAAIKSLIGRYFTKAKVFPLASYHFNKPYKQECSLQCCLSPDEAYTTLYKDRRLHWHQVFNYQNAEDLAYHIKLMCKEHDIDENQMEFQCAAISKGTANVIPQLSQYFPAIVSTGGTAMTNDPQWSGTVNLLQQLYACAL